LVHETPDDSGTDERDGHRHEDEDLVDLLASGAVDEDGVSETDDRRNGGNDEHPDDRVHDDAHTVGLPEYPRVVGESDEVLAGGVHEGCHERLQRRQDEPDEQKQESWREERDQLDEVSLALTRTVIEEEEDRS